MPSAGSRFADIAGRLAVAVVLLLWLASREKTHAQQPETLRVTTRLVTLNVVVRDKQGNPVTDLDKDDFIVLDSNQAQTISFFSLITNPTPSAPPLASPDTYTNVLAQNGARPSGATIILFDALNAKWTSQGFGLNQIRKFLSQIDPREHVGIYVLGYDLKVIHEFTQDASELIAGIRRYEQPKNSVKQDSASEASTGVPELDRFLKGKDNTFVYSRERRGNPIAAAEFGQFRYKMTLASLEAIIRHLTAVPGRKSLVWVSDGVPLGEQLTADEMPFYEGLPGPEPPKKRDATSSVSKNTLKEYYHSTGLDLERVVRLMNNAGVAIYPVDTKGLQAFDLGFGAPGSVGVSRGAMDAGHWEFDELARRTGGRALYNRNDLATGIRRAVDDSRATYSIAYYPDHNQWDGKFKKVTVKVSRPEVDVLVREGYFAVPEAKPVLAKDRLHLMIQIAASPIDATAFPLTVHIDPIRDAGTEALPVKVEFNSQPLFAQSADSRWRAKFEILFMQMDAKHNLLDVTNKSVDADLDSTQYQKNSQEPTELHLTVNLKPHATTVCIILRDDNSDAIASLHIPVRMYAIFGKP